MGKLVVVGVVPSGARDGTCSGGLGPCAVLSNNTNTPVFFMLRPERTAPGDLSSSSMRGKERLQPGGNKQVREGQGYEGDGHFALKFS